VHLARLILTVVGVGMIVYLISMELFVIKAICLWCSSVHLTTFLLFVIVVTSSPVVLGGEYGDVDLEPWYRILVPGRVGSTPHSPALADAE
jgi:hypothetical protein